MTVASEDNRILLWFGASVIEQTVVREALYRLFMGQRREEDRLIVFDQFNPRSGAFYVSEKVEKDDEYEINRLGSLYVDEGYFDGTLRRDTVLNGNQYQALLNKGWDELCDFTDFMGILVRKFAPDAEIKHTQAIGRGFRKTHYLGEYQRVLTPLIQDPEHPLGKTFRLPAPKEA